MILYFSTTGNSKWVAEQLAALTHDVTYNLLDTLRTGCYPDLTETEVVGVVFPIHSWGTPQPVVTVLKELSLQSNSYRYAVCTCGDDCGKAMNMLNKVFPLHAAWSVAMPNTYVPLFKLDSDALSSQKIREAYALLPQIAEAVGKRMAMWQVHEGAMAWLKSYLVHPSFVKYVNAKGFHLEGECSGCGICVKSCPMQNLSLSDGLPIWGKNCLHCMACYHACPKNVIHYKKDTQHKGQYKLSKYLSAKR